MDAPYSSLADSGPLAATLLADALLEQTWIATAPETWYAAPLIVVLTCAFALSTGDTKGCPGADTMARLAGVIRSDPGVWAAIRAALRELRALAAAREVLVALEVGCAPPLLFAEGPDESGDPSLTTRTLGAHERSTYFFSAPSCTRASNGVSPFETPSATVPEGFRRAHPFDAMAGFAFESGEWHVRLFLLDPAEDTRERSSLRTCEHLLRELLPALARMCDLHAQRHRAAERERARLGRELHDGIVQELTCLDMELELIGVSAPPQTGLRERIKCVQQRLRGELRCLRTLLQDARCNDVDPSRLPAVLEAIVHRFGRDARVHADYVSRVTAVGLPPQVCGEIAKIVQEALVNVRRHSGARHVVVTFSCDNADWKLSIQDDGRGFAAGRRRRSEAAQATALPPSVIDERVHSLGGTVRVVTPGTSGARLEISARQRNLWNRMA
jgi:signal transduction histidine kinase